MFADAGRPILGHQGKMLGVRTDGADLPIEANDHVHPATGGLSVAPEWRKLPAFLVPRRLVGKFARARGNNALSCFRLGELPFMPGQIGDELMIDIDSPKHATIQPAFEMTISTFQDSLAATRDDWIIDED